MTHVETRDLLSYFAENLSVQERLPFDIHFAECPQCAKRMQVYSYIKNNFASLLDSWTPEEHGRAYRQFQIAEALSAIQKTSSSLKSLINNWADKLQRQADVFLNLLFDKMKNIATIGAELLPVGMAFHLEPVVSGIGSPEEIETVENHRRQSSKMIGVCNAKGAENELINAAKINARSVSAAESSIKVNESIFARIVVDSRRECIYIKAFPQPGKESPRLALLLPSQDPASAKLTEFKPVEDENYFVAEFDSVPSGEWELILEG